LGESGETSIASSLSTGTGSAGFNGKADSAKEEQMTFKTVRNSFRRLQRRNGQSLVEYALILALISVVAILVLKGIGTSVNTKLENVNGNLQ
jgi:Flp pilus assembly pilin Flp